MTSIEFYPIGEKPEYSEEIVIKSAEWGPENQEWLRDTIKSSMQTDKLPKIIIGLIDSKVIGYYSILYKDLLKEEVPYTPWLGDLFIFKEFRKKNYSPIFIEHACNNAKSMGYNKIYLCTELINFYEKYNFKFIRKSKGNWTTQDTKIYERELI